jgi:hypothetical protein
MSDFAKMWLSESRTTPFEFGAKDQGFMNLVMLPMEKSNYYPLTDMVYELNFVEEGQTCFDFHYDGMINGFPFSIANSKSGEISAVTITINHDYVYKASTDETYNTTFDLNGEVLNGKISLYNALINLL